MGCAECLGQAGVAEEVGDPGIRPGTSPGVAVEQPLAELDRGSTTALARGRRRAVNASHRSSSTGFALDQQLAEHRGVLERLRRALGQGRRAGVGGVADQHDPAAVPRGVEHVRLEPGVVDRSGSVIRSRMSSHGPW